MNTAAARTMGAGLLMAAMTVWGAGCTLPVDTAGRGQSAQAGRPGDPAAVAGTPGAPQGVDANTRYVPEQDQAKAMEIATRMWQQMTAAPCWYLKSESSSIGTYNYSFSNYNDYRYAGYETTSGQVKLVSAGKFGPYDTAEVVISSTTYWIAILDPQWLTITSIHDNGQPIINYYYAASPGQICV